MIQWLAVEENIITISNSFTETKIVLILRKIKDLICVVHMFKSKIKFTLPSLSEIAF